jgi:hypothetical protein
VAFQVLLVLEGPYPGTHTAVLIIFGVLLLL